MLELSPFILSPRENGTAMNGTTDDTAAAGRSRLRSRGRRGGYAVAAPRRDERDDVRAFTNRQHEIVTLRRGARLPGRSRMRGLEIAERYSITNFGARPAETFQDVGAAVIVATNPSRLTTTAPVFAGYATGDQIIIRQAGDAYGTGSLGWQRKPVVTTITKIDARTVTLASGCAVDVSGNSITLARDASDAFREAHARVLASTSQDWAHAGSIQLEGSPAGWVEDPANPRYALERLIHVPPGEWAVRNVAMWGSPMVCGAGPGSKLIPFVGGSDTLLFLLRMTRTFNAASNPPTPGDPSWYPGIGTVDDFRGYWQAQNHNRGWVVRDLFFDGLGRAVPVNGLDVDWSDHFWILDCGFEEIAGSALNLISSCREARIRGLHLRYCGTATKAAIDIDNKQPVVRQGGEGHNNLHLSQIVANYSHGDTVLIGTTHTSGGGGGQGLTRMLAFNELMIHGPEEDVYGDPTFGAASVLMRLDACRDIYLSQARLHEWGRQGLRIGTGCIGIVSLQQVNFGAQKNVTPQTDDAAIAALDSAAAAIHLVGCSSDGTGQIHAPASGCRFQLDSITARGMGIRDYTDAQKLKYTIDGFVQQNVDANELVPDSVGIMRSRITWGRTWIAKGSRVDQWYPIGDSRVTAEPTSGTWQDGEIAWLQGGGANGALLGFLFYESGTFSTLGATITGRTEASQPVVRLNQIAGGLAIGQFVDMTAGLPTTRRIIELIPEILDHATITVSSTSGSDLLTVTAGYGLLEVGHRIIVAGLFGGAPQDVLQKLTGPNRVRIGNAATVTQAGLDVTDLDLVITAATNGSDTVVLSDASSFAVGQYLVMQGVLSGNEQRITAISGNSVTIGTATGTTVPYAVVTRPPQMRLNANANSTQSSPKTVSWHSPQFRRVCLVEVNVTGDTILMPAGLKLLVSGAMEVTGTLQAAGAVTFSTSSFKAAGLPTTNPNVAGMLWVDGSGFVKRSAG